MDGINNDGGFGGSESRHIEGEVGEAIGSGERGLVEKGGGAFDLDGGGGTGDGSAGGILDENHKLRVLAFEPGSRIGELKVKGDRGQLRRYCFRSGDWRRRENQDAGAHFFEDHTVLRVEAELQGGFLVLVERQKVEVIVDEAMEDTATAVDGGFEKSVVDAAILGLHVIDGAVKIDVGIVAEDHRDIFGKSAPNLRQAQRRLFFRVHLTDCN